MNESIKAKGLGNINSKNYILVFYIPNLSKNHLLSVNVNTEHNAKVTFIKQVTVTQNSKKVLKGYYTENGVYKINIDKTPEEIFVTNMSSI